jgi:hypothetical protein
MERKDSRKGRGRQRQHTTRVRQHTMDTPGKEVADLLMGKLHEGHGIDIASFVSELTAESSYGTIAQAFEQILNDPKASDSSDL